MDDGRGLNKASRPAVSRARIVGLLCGASAVLMLAATTPRVSPDAVFPTYYSVELLSSLLLGGLYLSSLLYAGQRWIQLTLDVPRDRRGDGRTLVVAGLVVCAFALLTVPVEALRIVGGPLSDLLNPGSWWVGVTPEARTSLAMSLLGVGVVMLSKVIDRHLWCVVAWIAPLVVVLAPTWLGHSRSETPRLVMIGADAVHLIAAAWWLSGVMVFAVMLSVGPRRSMRAAEVTEAVARFSIFAWISAVAVAASGVVMAALIMDGVGDIVGSGWGRALLIKILLVAAVVGVARWNTTGLRAKVECGADEERRWAILRVTLVSEVVLLVTVVMLTGFITQMSPG